MDFVVDGLASGRMIRMLSGVDAFTRECLALEADTSLGSGRVTRVPEQLIEERGQPESLRSDNGPKFTSHRMLGWAEERKITLIHIQPGMPIQNGHVQSFHGRLRDECLNVSWFRTLNNVRNTWQNGSRSITENGHITRWDIERRSSSDNKQAMQMWKANNASTFTQPRRRAKRQSQRQNQNENLWLIMVEQSGAGQRNEASEIFGLKWAHLNLDRAILRVRRSYVDGVEGLLKTNCSRRPLPIPPQAVDGIKAWKTVHPMPHQTIGCSRPTSLLASNRCGPERSGVGLSFLQLNTRDH